MRHREWATPFSSCPSDIMMSYTVSCCEQEMYDVGCTMDGVRCRMYDVRCKMYAPASRRCRCASRCRSATRHARRRRPRRACPRQSAPTRKSRSRACRTPRPSSAPPPPLRGPPLCAHRRRSPHLSTPAPAEEINYECAWRGVTKRRSRERRVYE